MNQIIESYETKFSKKGFEISCFEGCSDDDIVILKLCQNIDYLPPLYIEFMKRFGKNIHQLINHYWDLSFGDVIFLKQHVISLYDADPVAKHRLPDDAFVFNADCQGIYYCYFLTGDKNPNPPIFKISGGDGEVAKVTLMHPSLSRFYDDYILAAGKHLNESSK